MAFVKLDCGILSSSIWVDKPARDVFLTALLMAEPYVLEEPSEQLEIRSLESTGFIVPPGCYGFVRAASSGIIRHAGLDMEPGLDALERLGAPEVESRSTAFDGRRLARIDGGFVVLNFDKYRQKDGTAADRMKRYRERQREDSQTVTAVTRNERNALRNVTHADAEA